MATLEARRGMTRRYELFRRFVIFVFRVFLGLRLHGEENVPRSGPVVVAANHWRFFDPVFVCAAVPRRVQWMAKKELFARPLVPVFRVLGAFPVDREGGGRRAIRTALEYLEAGWALGIFPEGTRRKEKSTGEAKSGAVMLAGRSGAPIVPVYIGPIPSLRERLSGKRFEAYVGEPLPVGKDLRGRTAYRELANEAIARIYALPESGQEKEAGGG